MRTLVILIILAFSGYLWHTRRERFTEFESLQGAAKATERRIDDRQKEIAKLLERVEPLRRSREEISKPEGSPDHLEKDVEALKESLKDTTTKLEAAEAEFSTVLTAVRDLAKTKTIPLLKLPSGDEFQECTITKFGEGYISLSHKDGITRVQADDLPEGWVAKYSVDYVSKDSQAEKETIAARVAEATTKPLDLKNAQLGEIDARLADLNAQLLSMSVEIREATRKADVLVRDAYRIALDKGAKGQAAASKRAALFDQSRKVESGREGIRAKYKALRAEKLALEQQRNELRRKRAPTPDP